MYTVLDAKLNVDDVRLYVRTGCKTKCRQSKTICTAYTVLGFKLNVDDVRLYVQLNCFKTICIYRM